MSDEIERTRLIHPELMNVEEWMRSLKAKMESEERLTAEGTG